MRQIEMERGGRRVPVVMAGVLGVYGLIIVVIISTGVDPLATATPQTDLTWHRPNFCCFPQFVKDPMTSFSCNFLSRFAICISGTDSEPRSGVTNILRHHLLRRQVRLTATAISDPRQEPKANERKRNAPLRSEQDDLIWRSHCSRASIRSVRPTSGFGQFGSHGCSLHEQSYSVLARISKFFYVVCYGCVLGFLDVCLVFWFPICSGYFGRG